MTPTLVSITANTPRDLIDEAINAHGPFRVLMRAAQEWIWSSRPPISKVQDLNDRLRKDVGLPEIERRITPMELMR